VAIAPAPEQPLDVARSLRHPAQQLVEAHSGPAGRDAAAVAEDQPVASQLPHSALNGVLFAVAQVA